MNIITASQKVPSENGRGDQHLLFNRITALINAGHDIDAVFFKENSKKYINSVNRLIKLGVNVHEIRYSYTVAIIYLIRYLFKKEIPLQSAIYTSNNYKKKIIEIVNKKSVGLIYISFIRILFNTTNINSVKYLDMIDSMSMNYHRRKFKYNIIFRLIFTLEAQRIKILEKKIFNYADKVSVVSNIDKTWIDNNKIHVFPLGVDTVKFHPSSHKNSSLTIIFSGNLSYKPNEQAVLWFLENCWMKILALHPNIMLVLAGRVGSFEIGKFNKYKNIVITGEVAFIEDYIKKADIAIAPMQCGSGMQNKILEAMSCGLAVVSTPMGMGDIKAKNYYNIILAECPNKFIKSIDYLIKNKKRRNEIGAAARKLIQDYYSWEKSNIIFFDQILQNRT